MACLGVIGSNPFISTKIKRIVHARERSFYFSGECSDETCASVESAAHRAKVRMTFVNPFISTIDCRSGVSKFS